MHPTVAPTGEERTTKTSPLFGSKSSDFTARYERLNESQRKAVDAIEGPVLVLAGPGSGKTELLAVRIANILKQSDAQASNILCLTFTKAAATNMRERLVGLIGRDAYHVTIATFHQFCADTKQRFPHLFHSGATFQPSSDLAKREILQSLFERLSYNHPLSSYHPEQGYVYLLDVARSLKPLKEAGITPDILHKLLDELKQDLDQLNPLIGPVFDTRLSKASICAVGELVAQIEPYCSNTEPTVDDLFPPLRRAIIQSLTDALAGADALQKITPLSAWKAGWLGVDDNKQRVLKETLAFDRLRALAELYDDYQQSLHDQQYFDFDDMILDVLHAMEVSPELTAELQETYQYILVDEFQDTNEAQMRLLTALTNHPMFEGRPNVLAVGDDDQSIYKFQGAEIANIGRFLNQYEDPLVVTLSQNYRSGSAIVDFANATIQSGECVRQTVVDKPPSASKKETPATVEHCHYKSALHEIQGIVEGIKDEIARGIEPHEIAVIARRHKDFTLLIKALNEQHIAVDYQRSRDVLLQQPVQELIALTRYILSLSRKNPSADELLPELLRFAWMPLSTEDIWDISLKASRSKMTWMEVMRDHASTEIQGIRTWFLELARTVDEDPLDVFIDKLVGSAEEGTTSLFKEHYFGKTERELDPTRYLRFLSGLQTLHSQLQQLKDQPTAKDFLTFVDAHTTHHMTLQDTTPITTNKQAVSLVTAHGAKGLEFETVFVIRAQESIWAGRGIPAKIPFPKHLPIMPGKETEEDHLRLFYVAITRAKTKLVLTSHEKDEEGVGSLPLRFCPPATAVSPNGNEVQLLESQQKTGVKISASMEVLLRDRLHDYQLSVTHLHQFLDVSRGGPQQFLERSLLRFPQAKSAAGAYGSAVHAAIQWAHVSLKQGRELTEKEFLKKFDESLTHESLAPGDDVFYRDRGHEALACYFHAKLAGLELPYYIEHDFKFEGVIVNDVRLTGKIDKMVPSGTSMHVIDFKTGKATTQWKGRNDNESIKLYQYRRQLLFYKLLLEQSKTFGRKFTVRTGTLSFVEPKGEDIIDLNLEIDNDEVDRLKKIIGVVGKHIHALDLPDVSHYPPTLDGMKQFEDDLLKNGI